MEEAVAKDKRIRTLTGKRAGTNIVGMDISDTASASFDLDYLESAFITMTLAHSEGLRLFGIPQMTFYVDSVSAANSIYGTTYQPSEFNLYQWLDWSQTDNNNIILAAHIKNMIPSTQTILVRGNWRFIIEEGNV